MSADTIRAEFESLTLAQAYGAIACYLDNQPAIDAHRIRQEQKFGAMRSAAEPLPETGFENNTIEKLTREAKKDFLRSQMSAIREGFPCNSNAKARL